MVKIRLRRTGSKNSPCYRVVVADARAPRDGRIIENLGHYNPRVNPSEVVINTERAVHWLDSGAQPTETVRSLLRKVGAMRIYESSRDEALKIKKAGSAGATPVDAQAAAAE